VITKIILLCIACFAMALAWLWQDFLGTASLTKKVRTVMPTDIISEPKKSAAQPLNIVSITETEIDSWVAPVESVLQPEVIEEDTRYAGVEIKSQVGEIADHFEQMIQFPASSIPIFSHDAISKYVPNQASEISYEEGGDKISMVTDQYRYAKNQNVFVDVITTAEDSNIEVNVSLLHAGNAVAQTELITQKDGLWRYELTPQVSYDNNGDLLVVASLTTNVNTLTVSAAIVIESQTETIATVTSMDKSYVDAEWLAIPFTASVHQPGFYRLEANLYSKKTNKPLLHLFSESELKAGAGSFELRAHWAALKVMGEFGDYIVKDFWFTKMPSPPDFETKRAEVQFSQMTVTGYPLNSYEQIEHHDSEAEARLTFLESISQ